MSTPIVYKIPAVIDLDSFNAANYEKKKHNRVRSNIIIAVMAEVPEEEKDSNFGDYGPESDSDNETENSERRSNTSQYLTGTSDKTSSIVLINSKLLVAGASRVPSC